MQLALGEMSVAPAESARESAGDHMDKEPNDQKSRNLMALKASEVHKCLISLARPERFELPTSWFVAMRSIQLSYGRVLLGRRGRGGLGLQVSNAINVLHRIGV